MMKRKDSLMSIQHFFDENTHTFSYVVQDHETMHCAVIDSVLDYDAASAKTSTLHADQIIQYIKQNHLQLEWILETHVHADHLSAAHYLKTQLGGKVAMSHKIVDVQETFSKIYNLDIKAFNTSQPFDYLFDDEEVFYIGQLKAYNIPTPGHTPACLSYVIGDAVFVGDTLFMPDYGTARCDFPQGSAEDLYASIQRIYQLPEDTRVFLCHDYLPESRQKYQCESSVGLQKKLNIHVHQGITQKEFVLMRQARDATLSIPKLMLPAIQINMRAGDLPQVEENGVAYLKIPLNSF